MTNQIDDSPECTSPALERTAADSPAASGIRQVVRWIGTRQLLGLAVAYTLALASYHAAGLTFNVGYPQTVSQFVDAEMLRSDYVESLWYLHAQPPLFNAWMGAVQNWSPLSDAASYHLTFLALGALLALSLNVIARCLGMRPTSATVLAGVVAASPPTVLFQHWFFYDFPMAVLVAATLAALGLWLRTGRVMVGSIAVGSAAAAVLTRSMFHPIWLVAVAAVVVWTAPERTRRRAVAAVSVPVIVVASLMIKNEMLFGTAQLSSWFGFNLYRTTVLSQDAATLERWESKYDLPSVNETKGCTPSRPDVEILADRLKSDGSPNWNWECSLASFSEMERASVRVVKGEPQAVARSVLGSIEIWFSTTDLWFGVDPGRRQIEPASLIWRKSVGWDIAWNPPVDVSTAWVAKGPDQRNHLSLMALFSAVVVYLRGAQAARNLLRRDDGRGHGNAWAVDWLYLSIAGTVGFSFVVGTVFEHGENARFRFVTEPITLVTAVAAAIPAISAVIDRWRSRREVEPPQPGGPDRDGGEFGAPASLPPTLDT